MITPVRFKYPKVLAKTGTVPGAAKKNITSEHTNGAAKWIMPYGSHAKRSRMTNW